MRAGDAAAVRGVDGVRHRADVEIAGGHPVQAGISHLDDEDRVGLGLGRGARPFGAAVAERGAGGR